MQTVAGETVAHQREPLRPTVGPRPPPRLGERSRPATAQARRALQAGERSSPGLQLEGKQGEEASPMLAALVVIVAVVLVAGWEVFCLADLARADRVRFLPRWAWAVACLIQIPLGGVLYLLIGRVWARNATR